MPYRSPLPLLSSKRGHLSKDFPKEPEITPSGCVSCGHTSSRFNSDSGGLCKLRDQQGLLQAGQTPVVTLEALPIFPQAQAEDLLSLVQEKTTAAESLETGL